MKIGKGKVSNEVMKYKEEIVELKQHITSLIMGIYREIIPNEE